MAKIILWDLECTDLNADWGEIISGGWKYLGEKRSHVLSWPEFSKDPLNDAKLCKALSNELGKADIWVTHYGKRFDVPYLNSRLILHNLPPLPPIPHIDTWEIAKKRLKLRYNRLVCVQEFLGLETEKTKVSGSIWKKAKMGRKPELKYVVDHNEKDVEVLEEAYLRLRPLILNHPNVSVIDRRGNGCPICGSGKLQSRGISASGVSVFRRYQCQGCKGWSRGPGERIKGVKVR